MKAILTTALVIYAIIGVLFAMMMLLLDLLDRSKRTPVAVAVIGFILRAIFWLPIVVGACLIGRKKK